MREYESVFYGKNVLITGGLGFIGSNLAHKLVELEANVLLVDSLIPAYGGNLFNINGIEDKVKVNIADVRDANSLKYLVRGQDYIFNLAGQVSHIDSMKDPYTDLEINARSQLFILEACRRNNPTVKIIYASTRQIYGKPDYLPVDEKHLLHPTDVNGINKMAGEWYHVVYNNVYRVRSVSLRLTNTYGPRQLMKHNRQGFIGWFIRQAIDGQEIKIFGDGSQIRDLTYVDDVVDALLRAATSDASNGQIYNLGGLEPISLLELTQLLLEIAARACPATASTRGGERSRRETGRRGSYRLVSFPEDKKKIDIGDFYADYGKIKKSLGWQPRVCLQEGLERTIRFYRAHKEHYW
jgi:UDP-glucose 4-epimerase